jgi:hypothetical protein
MQRSAAASPSSNPSTPDGRSAKRVRLSNGGYGNSSPSTPSKDQLAIQAALAQEEQKRSHAIERQAEEAGESRWVLSEKSLGRPAPMLQIVHAGFAELDSASAMDEEDLIEPAPQVRQVAGRMVFGKVSGERIYCRMRCRSLPLMSLTLYSAETTRKQTRCFRRLIRVGRR